MSRAEASPGRVTLNDVARVAGVSTALVSIIIRGVPGASDETRQRVLAIAAELGYRPDQRARLLRQQRSRLIGVTFGVQHAFHGELVDSVYRAADAAGYEVVLSAVTPHRSESRAIETLLTDRCEAMILIGSQLRPAELTVLGGRLPVVVLTRRLRRPTLGVVDAVHNADAAGLQLAVDHLVELGHRDIAHIDGGSAPGSADRRHGYLQAMRRHGLAARSRVVAGGPTEADGARSVDTVLTGAQRPTALVCFNDTCAIGVLDTLLRAGIAVPEQLSVVGYDDSRLSRLAYISLTTIGQDVALLGQRAVERAIQRLSSGFIGDPDVTTEPHLVRRSTTAPPS